MKNKLKYIFILVLCFVVAISPKAFASYTLTDIDSLKAVWYWDYTPTGYHRGPSSTEIFHLSNGSEVRDAFCIQQLVFTGPGVVYDDPVPMDVTSVLSTHYRASNFMDESITSISALTNTADLYWNNTLSTEVKKSLNIAYVWWKTYYPNDKAAASATQMFLWSQTIGNAGVYLEARIGSEFRTETHTYPNGIDDGYRYASRSIALEKARTEKVYRTGEPYDVDLTDKSYDKFEELINYYKNFNNTAPRFEKVSGEDVLHPGESITWTDKNGVISNTTEWTVDYSNIPSGITVTQNGNDIVFTASQDYAGYAEMGVTATRFKYTSNDGKSRLYANGAGNQILFEGGLPQLATMFGQTASSTKVTTKKLPKSPEGDATVVGAQYRVWSDDTGFDQTITIGDDYTATTRWLEPGQYHVQETKAPKGYVLNTETYDVTVTKEDSNRIYVTKEVEEDIMTYALDVVKMVDSTSGSEESPAKGAVLRLSLISDPSYYLDVTLDNKGEGSFIENAYTSLYGDYTIPYGKYEMKEIAESEPESKTDYYIQPVIIDFTDKPNNYSDYKVIADEPVQANLKVIKRDIKTGEIIKLPGAKFKIWDVENSKWVASRTYPTGEEITEFETNEDGYFITQEAIDPGDYVIYEIQAPKGYYLEEDLRIPTDVSKVGTDGGRKIRIDKANLQLRDDTSYPQGGVRTGDLVYVAEIKENPLLVSLKLEKKGEKLDGIVEDTVSYIGANNEEVELERITPTYKEVGLQGVKYGLYAAEEIFDTNSIKHASADQLIETLITDENGIATTHNDIWPGTYYLKEISAPAGYIVSNVQHGVELQNEDQYVSVKNESIELSDVRQKLGYQFKKLFEQYKYATGGEQKHAVFGIYTQDGINNYKGALTIPADSLVELIEVDGNSDVTTSADLPEGNYYVQELYVSYPYALSTKKSGFTLTYLNDGTTLKNIIKSELEIVNTPDTGYARFIKLSKSITSRADEDEKKLILNGSEFMTEGLDQQAAKILEYVKNMTRSQMLAYFEEEGIQFIEGAEYEIWLDEKGTNKLQEVNLQTGDMKVATFSTDDLGILELFELPKGAFYLKETKAPKEYRVQNDCVPFEITTANPEATIYQAIYDESVIPTGLHKTDFFTGENVPNCKFEIRDEDDNLLLYSITDEEGMAYIPQDMFEDGKTYYYIEVEAPDKYDKDGTLYVLNTEPHEFTVHFDENGDWATERIEVQNYRPLTKVTLIKTDEEDNLVPNCKFELKSEEENLFYETGVTDENGIYVFKNVPQGWYTYTELEAPEEYDLDTTPHRVYVTGDEMIIEFVNTGDIPVVAIAVVAVVCVAGIAFVVIRKVKSNKKQ